MARKPLSRRKKLLFASVVPAILLLGECGARVAGFPKGLISSSRHIWASEEERDLGPFRPGSEATLVWPPELPYHVKINALGLRGPAPSGTKPLVLCVGDSTTYGMYASEEETYPALLPGALQAKGVEAEALNAGCPRWTIGDERELIQAALPRVKPKAVVLLFCGNDLTELDKPPAKERVSPNSAFSRLTRKVALTEALMWIGLEARRAWLRAKGEWPAPLRPDQGMTASRENELWQRWAAGLAQVKAECGTAGVRLIVAAFPAYLEVEADAPCHVEQVLPGLVRQAGAEYLDLYPAFRAAHRERPRAAFLLPNDAHASRQGNELIAREVAAALARGW